MSGQRDPDLAQRAGGRAAPRGPWRRPAPAGGVRVVQRERGEHAPQVRAAVAERDRAGPRPPAPPARPRRTSATASEAASESPPRARSVPRRPRPTSTMRVFERRLRLQLAHRERRPSWRWLRQWMSADRRPTGSRADCGDRCRGRAAGRTASPLSPSSAERLRPRPGAPPGTRPRRRAGSGRPAFTKRPKGKRVVRRTPVQAMAAAPRQRLLPGRRAARRPPRCADVDEARRPRRPRGRAPRP